MRASMLIPREAWGAAPPRYPVTMVKGKDLVIIHHAGVSGYWPTPTEETAAMRFWQLYHQGPQHRGADIYYGAVIFPSGRAYEGRQGGWLANNGGAYSCNERGFGVCLAGNFNSVTPTLAALETLVNLALEAQEALGVPADRYWGHRDCAVYDSRNRGNDCPGEIVYRWLPALRGVVAAGKNLEESEMAIYHPERQADQGGKYVYKWDDALVGGGWRSYYNLYNEDYPEGVHIEIFTSQKQPPIKATVRHLARYSLDLQAAVGSYSGGFAVIVKTDKPDPGTVTVFRG